MSLGNGSDLGVGVIELYATTVVRDGQTILGPIDFKVSEGQRWIVIGPNGAGKTTLFQLCASNLHPTSGSAIILGELLGRTDVFELRPRIGLMASNLATDIPQDERVLDLVLSSTYGIVGRWNENYDLWDESRALSLLTTLGVRELKERRFASLSEGEKKRVLIARALMPNPELLLLDEPASGLDLSGREDLLKRLNLLAIDPQSPATIIVTHHLEEIPLGSTHALLLSGGAVVAQGPIDLVLTSENLTAAYGLEISLTREGGRFFAKAL